MTVTELGQAMINEIERNPKEFVKQIMGMYKRPIFGIRRLKKILDEANERYRNMELSSKELPLLSDRAYDILEEEYNMLATGEKKPKKPVVGAKVRATDARKQKLPFWMGSMDKIKAEDEASLVRWKKSFTSGGFVFSDKLDGNSALLHYSNGGKTLAMYSRGDGIEGQNITPLIPHLRTKIPRSVSKEVAIRGELIISKKSFQSIQDRYANARNVVAGLVNSKEVNVEIAKLTEFVAYEMITLDKNYSIEDQLKKIRLIGIPCVHYIVGTVDAVESVSLSKVLLDRKKNSPYEVDGVIVQHNKPHARENEKNPSYAFAFKSMSALDTATVKVTSIEWNVSKDGLIKPVVTFDGVRLSGVVIRRATGHNAEFVQSNKLGPGAEIEITRSGDVIPYIVKVVQPAKKPQMPRVPYEWNKTGKDIVLIRDEADTVDLQMFDMKQIEHFVVRLGIKGVAKGMIKKLFDNGYDTVKKLINVQVDDLMKIEGIREPKARLIYNSLAEGVKGASCLDLMDASNSFGGGIGRKKLEAITHGLGLDEIAGRTVTFDELMHIDGIGRKTADTFINGLVNFKRFLKSTGLKCSFNQDDQDDDDDDETDPKIKQYIQKTFTAKIVVFTGFRSKPLEKLLARFAPGSKVASNVSTRTDILIKNEEKGAKYEATLRINSDAGHEKIKIMDWTVVKTKTGC